MLQRVDGRPVELLDAASRQGQAAFSAILTAVGEDPGRAGLVDTPRRSWDALHFLTSGYEETVEKVVGDALFEEEFDDLVLIKDIDVFSICEHHLLPFVGRAHIAYLPDGKIIGLSKAPRLVNMFARRLQVQERLTEQIATALADALHPRGVAVHVEASHMCMMMRGVEQTRATTVTEVIRGEFAEDTALYDRFKSML